MAIKLNNETYEVKPFDCWPLMKELRSKHFWHTWNAHQEGEFFFLGQVYNHHGFLKGWGNYANPSIGPHFTRLARTPNAEGLKQVIEAAEAWGLGRDICGAMKCHIGQIFSGLSQTSPSGEKVCHDMAISSSDCHAIRKTTELAAEYMGVPLFFTDHRMGRYNETTRKCEPDDNAKKYWLAQMHDSIEWGEKTLGRKYNDEMAIEGMKIEWRSRIAWAKCLKMMQEVPTPMSCRTGMSMRLPLVTNTADPEVAKYFDTLYDELKYRASKQITDHKYEKIRLNHYGIHPLYRADVLRSPELYGAVFLVGALLEDFAFIARDNDRHFIVPDNPLEHGLKLETREDILENLWQMVCLRMNGREIAENRRETWYARVLDFKADAVVVHNDRPCQVAMANTPESCIYLRERGIPVGNYTSSQGDPRDFEERRIMGPGGELPTFYESLGLTRLEDVAPSKAQISE